ncbi:MAG: UDP-galactopyranose mutase [Pseudomonadota bacterium]|nr:UDP-galactopyranose mutase [Pseudomonadota bacterium]
MKPQDLELRRGVRLAAVDAGHGFDTLVVGAGFAGSVIAERLASQLGQRVLVVDKRPHIGGNAYDRHDDAGVLIHPYGPHIFHTNSADVFDYLSQFTEWRPYQHRVLASVDGQLVPMPINLDTVNRLYGLSLTSFELDDFFAKVAEKPSAVKTSEDVVVSRVGRELYNKFFRGYTRKQWGLDPSELDASVTARVPTRTNRDDRYFTDTYQAMPLHGYTRMFERMLSHPNIKVMLNTDYREIAEYLPWRHMVYTGPVDAFFDHRHGKLPYRSLEFRHETLPQAEFQAVGTVNFPNDFAYTRVSEFKHLTGQKHAVTSVVYEYPRADGDPYYPVPRAENTAMYRLYEADAEALQDVSFTGRLATYKYYNMDQVVAQSLTLFKKLAAAHVVQKALGAGAPMVASTSIAAA